MTATQRESRHWLKNHFFGRNSTRSSTPRSSRPQRDQFRVDLLEPRVLLSADAVVAGATASLAGGMVGVSAELQQLITSNPVFDHVVPGMMETQGSGENATESSPSMQQSLDVSTDVDAASKKTGPGDFYYTGGGTNADRFQYIEDLATNPFVNGDGRDERALDAMDLNQDGSVQWDEAFNVMVAGQIQKYLNSTTIADQNSADGVTATDLGIQLTNFLNNPITGFHLQSYLSDRLDLSMAASNTSSGDDLKITLNTTLSFDRSDILYLGEEAERLGITTDPVLPGDSPSPTHLTVDAGVHFNSLMIGLKGAADGSVSNDDFVFSALDRPSNPNDGVVVSVEVDDSLSIDSSGRAIHKTFEVNVGFLGADVSNGEFFLDMDTVGSAHDPSNPDALGFSLSEQGTAFTSSIAADTVPEPVNFQLTNDVIFTLKVGTLVNSPAVEVKLLQSATSGNDALADLISQLDAAITSANSQLGAIITTSDNSGKIQLSLPGVNPSDLGFGNEVAGTGSVTAGAASPLIGSEAPPSISFLLSLNGAVPILVSFTPTKEDHDSDTNTPEQVTITTLISSLNSALASAGLGAVTASDSSGKVKLTGPGGQILEITRTLTLDTVEEITPAELASGQVFDQTARSGSSFSLDLTVQTESGLQKPDNSNFAPSGTIKLNFDPFDATKINAVKVDVNPVTGEDVLRASFVLTDAGGKNLADPVSGSDMQALLDFNVLTTAEMLGVINQVGNWLGRLSASDLLNKFDIPFASQALSQLLDLKDLLSDTLLIDDRDDGTQSGAGTNDVSRLLQWVKINGQDQLAARFGTAQELGNRLATVLNSIDDELSLGLYADDAAARSVIDPTYDPATHELTYNLRLDHTFVSQQTSLDFDMDLGSLGGVETNGKVKLEATGHFNWVMGITMGSAAAALTDGSALGELNSGAGVAINDHLALTSTRIITPITGRLSASANFNLTVARSTDTTGPTSYSITLRKINAPSGGDVGFYTDDNLSIDDLISDLNHYLASTGITAAHDGEHVVLKATDGTITQFNVSSSSGDTAFTELGLEPEGAATTSLISPAQVSNPAPGADITFSLAVKRGASTTTTAITVGTSRTNGNLIIDDLVSDINASLQAAGITDIIASQASGFLALSAVKADIDAFSVTPTGDMNAAKAAGLDLAAAKQALKDLGVDSATANAITGFTTGVMLRATGTPADPFGRLTAPASFDLNGINISVSKEAAAGNGSLLDLAHDINTQISDTALKGQIVADVDGSHLRFRAIDKAIASITISNLGVGAGTALGLAATTANRTLGVTANKTVPVSYGVTSDATFDVTVTGGSHAGVKHITLLAANTIGNRTVYDLAASLNNVLNAAFGGGANNPLVATIQAGQIVIGLKIGDGGGSALFDIAPPISNGLAPVADGITAFSVTPTNSVAASQLRLSSGVSAANNASSTDFVIKTRDGGTYPISLDSLRDTDSTHAPKLVGTIADLKALISSQTSSKVFIVFGEDNASLKFVDNSLPGDTNFADDTGVFQVLPVNGSPAAIQLGVFGADTSQLNVGTYSFNSNSFGNPDGIIEGTRIATVDVLDRLFIKKPASGDILSADIKISTVDQDNSASTPDATAEATFGFAGVKLATTAQNQTLFQATAAIPFIPSKVTLGSLFGGLGSIGGLRALVGLPTLTTSSNFEFSVSIFPDLSSLFSIPSSAKLKFNLSNLGVLQDVMTGPDITGVSLQAPSIGVEGIDIGNLANFEAIKFDNILQALTQIADFLSQFSALSFLEQDIPVLGFSVNDVLEIANKFSNAVQEIQQNPAGGIQLLQQKISEAFGIPNFANATERNAFFANLGISSPTDLIALALKDLDGSGTDNDLLRIDLRLPVGFSEGKSIDLDLGEALGVDLGPIDLQGGAGLNVKGYIDARLSFGVDLTDPTKIYLFDNASALFGGLSASASNLSFNAAIGPLGAFIRDGNIQLGLDFSLDNGSFSASSDHKALITDIGALFDGYDASLDGTIKATLPVYFPTESEFLGDIKLDISPTTSPLSLDTSGDLQIPDFSAPGVLTIPDFSNIDLNALNPLGSIPLMLDTLDFFLQGLQDVVDGEVFGIQLPIIGDQLSSAAGFIENLRQKVLGPIRQYVEQAPQLGQELIQKLLFSLLGPGSAGVSITLPGLGTQDLHTFLGLPSDFTGLGLLVDYHTGAPATDASAIDTAGGNGSDDFLWKFRLADHFTPTVNINFDLGWDALGLAMKTGLNVDIGWDLAMGLGVSTADGAYLYIGDQRQAGSSDDSELQLTLDVSLPDSGGPAIEGRLAFLQLLISESSVNDPDLEQDNTHFHAEFGVDLQEKNATGDDAQRLTFSELGSIDPVVSLTADAEVNLEIVAQFNEAILPDAVSALLPKISTRFVLDWETNNIFASDFDLGDSLKLLAFKEVKIDMGSFLGQFLGPVIEKIEEITGPLQPIIDVITAPIPVISQLAGQPVTLVDIAGMTGFVDPGMIYAIADIISLVNKVHGTSGSLDITLGNFALIDTEHGVGDGNLADQLSLPTFNISDDSTFNLNNALTSSGLGGLINGATEFLNMLNSSSGNDDVKNLSSGLISGSEAGSSGFKFPIFDDPSQIFGLLLGRDVDLIDYDLAPFKMDFSYTQKFPIWDGLWARITGSVGLTIDLAFGYDTHGVREFAEGGFSNPLDLLAGFFVSDTNLGTTDVPELILRGELAAGAELNLGIASAGAEGGIILTVNFDLYDPDHDGKVRIDELLGNFLYEFNYGSPALAPIAIFDVYGDIAAQLRLFVESAFFKFTFNITPPITLFTFSIPFERQPILATERGDGSLLLNIGPSSAQRLNGDTRDIGENINVESVSATEVLVWSDRFNVPKSAAQSYHIGENKTIVGYGGEGNDTIDIHGVTESGITFLLEGGPGDDEVHGGQGGGTIKGDVGNDKLFGGDGTDLIIGGEGNDNIEGGDGRDYIFGDTGTLTVDDNDTKNDRSDDQPTRIRSLVGDKDGTDAIKGQGGDDIIFGGGNIDSIEGNDGNDLIFGDGGNFDFVTGDVPQAGGRVDIGKLNGRGEGKKDLIQGNAGDDTILGGAGDDFIDGGADSDLIFGSVGFDTLYGGSANDFIYGGDNDDIIFGFRDPVVPNGLTPDSGDSADDGEDYIEGEEGNDYIRGQDANDTIHGNRGADILFGDAGNDIIGAGVLERTWETTPTTDNEAGPDIVYGGADDDTIDSGDAGDTVFGDDGLVVYLDFNNPAIAPFTTTGSRIRTDASGSHQLIGDGPESLIGSYATTDDDQQLSMDLIVTEPLATDGADRIIGGDGKDIILGGGGILDTIFGDFDPGAPPTGPRPSGQDVVIGDGGRVELFGRRYSAAKAISNALDGVDEISGNDGGDYIFGGGAADTIYGFEKPSFGNTPLDGVNENDVILGDNGQISFNPNETRNRITHIFTTAVVGDSGRSDIIQGNTGDDVILGGLNGSSDVLDGDVGNDIILGDNGELVFDGDGDLDTLDLIRSFRDGLGGVDIVSGDAGADVLIGGTAGDTIYGDNATASNGSSDGEDILLGDNADVVLIGLTGQLLVQVVAMPAPTAVDLIITTDSDESTGGADTMSGNAKVDIMLGGVNNGSSDTLYGDRSAPTSATITNDGNDILLGDNGLLDFTFGTDTDRTVLDLIRSAEDGLGGTDTLAGGKGSDVEIGGTGGDSIYGDDANASADASDQSDILVGDNADLFLVAKGLAAGGELKTALDAAVKTLKTTDEEHPEYGGVDTISGNASGDIIAGGIQGDTIYGDRAVPTAASISNEGSDTILGDNGSLEWLSTGRLTEITGIDISSNNPALWAKYWGAIADADLATLDLITTEQPHSGGRDNIFGDEGNDLVFGGTDSDTIHGDDGNEVAGGAGSNRDVLLGDHGRLYPQFSTLNNFNSRNFFAIDIGNTSGGEGDRIWGEEGADVMLGQQGDDRMWGGSGDDDMIGGHNVSLGYDELTASAIGATLNGGVNDLMDGGSGDDAMAGDNALMWRRADDLSPRFRLLTSSTIYSTDNATIAANVGGMAQSDPDDAVGRDITMLDHDDNVQTNPQGRFGKDVMAGGADSDVMFGELGNDLMQGDGFIGNDDLSAGTITNQIMVTDSGSNPDTDENLYFNIPEATTDADDYLEGNGGNDLMYGGLGEDDLIGGSSALFGLTTEQMRPDGADNIFGGAGIRIARNDVADAASLGHTRDADYVMGDNANVFRLVTASDLFLVFAYDNYAPDANPSTHDRIIPRAMQQLDYTLGGADFAGGTYVNGAANVDNGASDLIHGEDGDDVIFGMTGSDVIFGNTQDDDVVGGYGHDWISGGTGQDGVNGDDGLVSTSRNGIAEPLYGEAATSQETISTPGQIQYAVINVTGELKKRIELVPFSYDNTWNATDDEFPDNADAAPYADDIIFGGLGSDFLHGGSGDDAISGAEALEHAYVPVYDNSGNPAGVIDLGYLAVGIPTPVNPGNVLAFNPIDLDGQHLNNRFRAGEFALYDEYDPLRQILLTATGGRSITGSGFQFLLNFNKDEGVLRPGGSTPGNQNQSVTYPAVHDDGADAIFGDLGNDWLAGGTGRDDIYGGWGNDLLNADDDQTTLGADGTTGGANDVPDTHPTYEDRAYGGAGRDVLIGNTGGDRLIDWVGEYNSYLVPYAPFGQASVSRTLQPFLQEFLYALSKADGADQTQSRDTGADALRNGEPAGELGMVLQKDFAWGDQTGAPADPQAGNIPGGKRDVLRSADFNSGQSQGFMIEKGSWSVTGGKFQVAPAVTGGDALSIFNVDSFLNSYFELQATVAAVKPTGGADSNAYVLFDYQSPTDFKFAGINTATNKLELGHRSASGWIVDKQASYPSSIKPGTDYNLFLSINGSTVTLIVNNQVSVTHGFPIRVDVYGFSHGINDGLTGLGARNSQAQIDNVVVQQVPPLTTLNQTVDFSSGPTSLFAAPISGVWNTSNGRYEGSAISITPAIDLTTLRVSSTAMLDLQTTLRTNGEGGIIFDQYATDDFKFATLSLNTKQVILGHRTAHGWYIDAVKSLSNLTSSTDTNLQVTLKGTTVSVIVNGQLALSRAYNAVVTDGGFGLLSRTGQTSFDSIIIKTDDPIYGSPI